MKMMLTKLDRFCRRRPVFARFACGQSLDELAIDLYDCAGGQTILFAECERRVSTIVFDVVHESVLIRYNSLQFAELF